MCSNELRLQIVDKVSINKYVYKLHGNIVYYLVK